MENKERIYTDKLKAFQSELRAIQDGTQPEFLERLADLEDTRDTMIDQKRLFRNFQLECAGNQYELETKQAEEEYMAEKQGLREKMLAGVEERRKKLKEDKDNLDISNDVVIESQTRMHKRNLRKRGMEQNETKASKKRQLQAPPFTFGLKEEDLMNDLLVMRKGMTTTKAPVKAKK
ncbi:Sds3-like protein [Jimgerdemannia flammicorona]|uniref:Sds3-like protein n=1 Tax=Jimgerdemannia flammicorona TaxID=994334 RepID=A0A433QBP3_9FUNG|nr:Sds3-like protein [Jimgerdemannia flammicorona]